METNQEIPNIEEKKCDFSCCSCSGWKVIVCVILGLLIVAGAVYAGIQIGRKSVSPRELLIPPKPITTQIPIDNGPVEIEVSPAPEAIPTTPSINETKDWEVYTNPEYKFSFRFPTSFSYNVNNQRTFIQVIVNENRPDFFVVMARKEYLPNDVNYFLDTESNGEKESNTNIWKTYYLPQGYGDGPSDTRTPIFGLQIEKNRILYSVRFINQRNTTDLQDQILSTFRFD